MAVSGNTNYFELRQKIHAMFTIALSESCSSGYPERIALSHDCQWIAFSCTNNEVKIYRNMPPFTLVQTLTTVSLAVDLAISGSHLFVVSSSPSAIRYYSHDGSQFVFEN